MIPLQTHEQKGLGGLVPQEVGNAKHLGALDTKDEEETWGLMLKKQEMRNAWELWTQNMKRKRGGLVLKK